MNPKSYLEVRFGLVRYTGVVTGNECADLISAGSALAPGMTKLAGHKEFAVSSDANLLGRTVDLFVKNGKVVGLPCVLISEISHTFTSAQDMALLVPRHLQDRSGGGTAGLRRETAVARRVRAFIRADLQQLLGRERIGCGRLAGRSHFNLCHRHPSMAQSMRDGTVLPVKPAKNHRFWLIEPGIILAIEKRLC